MSDSLFVDKQGKWYTPEDMKKCLTSVDAAECDVLFVHSDISFGLPSRDLRRKQYLDTLLQTILDTGVRTVIFPAFTYSFCNNEIFDVCSSATSMGALNEYARKQAGMNRSLDPLLSVSVFGEDAQLFTSYQCDNSLGKDSIFDVLHHTPGVKFLFFGAEFSNCFTYVHYVEKMMDVPYRFDMKFSGKIIDWAGKEYQKTQYIHTACERIKPIDFYHFKDFLIGNGCLKLSRLGDREVVVIDESDAYFWIQEKINERIDYFLEHPFTEDDLSHVYTYCNAVGRITHC